MFVVQFIKFRRGVPEVSGELSVVASDAQGALAIVQNQASKRDWPMRTDALRVMDDHGRTLLELKVLPPAQATDAVKPSSAAEPKSGSPARPAQHCFAVGQPVSYSEDGRPEKWRGGFEILRLEKVSLEPQYAIRNASQSYDRVVFQHELREDLGSRARGI